MAALGGLMAIALVAMMLLTVVDVVGRYVFNHPVPGSSEIIEYLLATLVFGTLPIASAYEEHIVVDILDFLFKGRAKEISRCWCISWVRSASLSSAGGWSGRRCSFAASATSRNF